MEETTQRLTCIGSLEFTFAAITQLALCNPIEVCSEQVMWFDWLVVVVFVVVLVVLAASRVVCLLLLTQN